VATRGRRYETAQLEAPPGGIRTLAELDQSFEDAWAAEHDMGVAAVLRRKDSPYRSEVLEDTGYTNCWFG
jgi:hypothetical protein